MQVDRRPRGRFSLGFGPSLKKKWGETEYRLGICPIGGYVKMAGEEPTPDKPPEPGEFYSKSVGRRSIVFVAGVVMNLIFGFVAFMLAYQIGVPVQPAIVGGVRARLARVERRPEARQRHRGHSRRQSAD